MAHRFDASADTYCPMVGDGQDQAKTILSDPGFSADEKRSQGLYYGLF
jgi:hypothetical protein